MNLLRKPIPALPLLLGLFSLVLFVPGIAVMEKTRAWIPTLQVAVPAIILASVSFVLGAMVLSKKPKGGTYGLAMTGSLTGIFSILFWGVMVPMMMIFAIPAREADPEQPLVEQSAEQMKIWVRHLKTFQQDHGRLPVKIEELIEKGYAPEYLLYDPRQLRRDAPSYRIMLREMPPESDWGRVPILEGRIPNPRDGTRLIAYPDESTGTLAPPVK